MMQSSTPNDLVKNLYDPFKNDNKVLTSDEQIEFVSFEKIKNQLDQAYLEPSEQSIQKILKYAAER